MSTDNENLHKPTRINVSSLSSVSPQIQHHLCQQQKRGMLDHSWSIKTSKVVQKTLLLKKTTTWYAENWSL